MDTFIAGIACSAIGGEVIMKKDIPNISDLEQNLSALLEDNLDKSILNECRVYLQLLRNIHFQLLMIAR